MNITIAEAKGKISGSGSNLNEKMEDLLTSDVFTACKYLPPTKLLIPFLKKAVNIDKKHLLLPNGCPQVKYKFWPSLTLTEPDVLIMLDYGEVKHIILIEAKYLSGKSSNREDIELTEALSDQLAKEYKDLMELGRKAFNLGDYNKVIQSLVYLTAHRLIPKDSMEDSIGEIKKKKFDIHYSGHNMYWLSWFELYALLNKELFTDNETLIVDDLRELLETKSIMEFQGFSLKHELEKIEPQEFYRRN